MAPGVASWHTGWILRRSKPKLPGQISAIPRTGQNHACFSLLGRALTGPVVWRRDGNFTRAWTSEGAFRWCYWGNSLLRRKTVNWYLNDSNGAPLQCSRLENPMDGGAWWAAAHGVAEVQTWLSDFTFTFHSHALEKEMATHSSVLAWRIPGTEEPGGLPSMGSHRVRHNWSDLVAESFSPVLILPPASAVSIVTICRISIKNK